MQKGVLKSAILSFLIITIVALIVLLPSFSLAFQDDDWRGIVLPKTEYAHGRLFTPYGIQLWFCAILYDLFGTNFPFYYIFSFILRISLSFAIFFFLYNLTRNKLASFCGSLLMAVTFSGLQTTYEIANTNVYIALIGFVVFLFAFISSLIEHTQVFKKIIIMIFSLVFITLASPVRTYPLFIWVLAVDIVGLVLFYSRERLKAFVTRQSIIYLTFLGLYFVGLFGWFSLDSSREKSYDIKIFFEQISTFFLQFNTNIFLNFLKGIGNIFIPSTLDKSGKIALITAVIYILSLTGILISLIKKRNEKNYLMFSFFLWPLIFFTGYFIVVLGGYGESSKETVILESYRRYLLPPFLGVLVSMAILLTNYAKRFSIYLVIIFISLHAFSTNYFLNDLIKYRDGRFMTKIWSQFIEQVPKKSLDPQDTNVFYFETDGSKRAIYTLDDGFILHATTLYKIPQGFVDGTPEEITNFTKRLRHTFNFNQLIDFVEKGFLNDSKPLSWDRIFAFRVEGEKLIDIKNETKIKVKKEINKK